MPGPAPQHWENYHRNIQVAADRILAVRRSGRAMLAQSARQLRDLLGEALGRQQTMGIIGSGWSLSSLLGQADGLLMTDDLDGLAMATAADIAPGSALDPARCLFAAGGAKVHELAYYAELHGLQISTCGSYMEQSLAGSLATGVIGSRLGYGGVQNMVRGLHLVGGADRSVWVEPASRPALSDAAAATIADEVVRDDAVFEAALVHLGGLGLVNGALLALEPAGTYGVVRQRQRIDPAWLAALEAGDFRALARRIGHDADPAYYEVQLDVFDPFGSEALHTLFFADAAPSAPAAPGYAPSLSGIAAMVPPAMMEMEGGGGGLPPDIFALYSAAYFHPTSAGGAPEGAFSWRELHAKRADPALRGAIYTSAFAVDRARASQTIALCSQEFQRLQAAGRQRHMLFTLRFVSRAAGTMAFTTFPESMVVDMEGLMASPDAPVLGQAATAVLAGAGVPLRMHWGKLQESDAAMVEAAFGPAAAPGSAIGRWRAARRRLVDPACAGLLANAALARWGLIEPA